MLELDLEGLQRDGVVVAADENRAAAADADLDCRLRSRIAALQRAGADMAGRRDHSPDHLARSIDADIGADLGELADIMRRRKAFPVVLVKAVDGLILDQYAKRVTRETALQRADAIAGQRLARDGNRKQRRPEDRAAQADRPECE